MLQAGLLLSVEDLAVAPCHSVAFDGASFLIAWREPAVAGDPGTLDLYGAEIAPDGQMLQTFTISDEPDREGAPFLAASAHGHVLAVFSRFVPGAPHDSRQVRGRFLTVGSPIPEIDAGLPGPGQDAGGTPADPPPGGGQGCGCTAGAGQPAPVAPLLLLGGVIALCLFRRRTRPAR